jgi:hypothetical protein
LMQRLGHDHIVASRHLQGYVLLKDDAGTADACRATFFVPLAALIVDDPALREQANLTTKPSPASIAGTKRNMLLSLDAEVFPFVHLTSTNCSPGLTDQNRRQHLAARRRFFLASKRLRNYAIFRDERSVKSARQTRFKLPHCRQKGLRGGVMATRE